MLSFIIAVRGRSEIKREDLKYYVSSPFWMKFRLLLFWILWATLIMAIIIIIFAHFWFTSGRYSLSTRENINIMNR